MSRLIQVAWLLPALYFLLLAARSIIADCRGRGRDSVHGGRSWSDRVPEQRNISGRY